MRLNLLLVILGCAGAPTAQDSRPFLALPATLPALDRALPPAAPPASHPAQRVAFAQALQMRFPAERYVLEAKAATLGQGPGEAFAFVRDRFRFETYAGVLRGARGCFAARAGNALDRSLALSELLRAKGVQTRFARGRLSDADAQRLLDLVFAPAPPVTSPAPSGDVQRSTLPDRVLARASRDYGAIRSALGATLPPLTLPSRDELLAELREHFWVQAKEGAKWVDLDAAFPDAKPGEARAPVEETMAELPDSLHQHLTLRVVTEHVRDRKLVEKVVLEAKVKAEDAIDAQILLAHSPDSGARGVGNAIAGASPLWAPILWIDETSFVGERIDYGTAKRGGIADALASEPTAAAPSPFVSETLELEVSFPDGRTDVVRRALVDRASPAWRAAGDRDLEKLAPLAVDARGPVAARTVHSILASGGKHDLASFSQALTMLAEALVAADAAKRDAATEGDAKPGDDTDDDPLATLWPLYLQTLGWMIWSDHTVVPGLDDLAGLRSYVDSPRIWITSLETLGEDLRIVFDLRRDKVRTIGREPAELGLAAAERKLWFAVLQGALEHEAMAERAASRGAPPDVVETTSARLDPTGVVVLAKSDLSRVAELVGADARKGAFLRAALERGSVVVAPRVALASGEPAWWEIHRRGDARAVYGDDWNGARFSGAEFYRRGARSTRPPRLGGDLPRGSMTRGGGRATGAGSYQPPKPTKVQPKTGRAKGGGGELGEYLTMLLEISVPASYGWFAVGLGVEVTAGAIGAILIEENAR